jgi:hypothetical protein
MKAPSSTTANDVETRGFAHIPGFLSEDEIEAIAADCRAAPFASNRHQYTLKFASTTIIDRFRPKLIETCARLGLRARFVLNCFYFPTREHRDGQITNRAYAFHQDNETYYIWQDHQTYLNFYIPVIKPTPDKSNVTVAPFDRLKARCPAAHDKLIGRGAHRLFSKGATTEISDDNVDGNNLTVELDFNEIGETPSLRAGDLLLMRGDLVHRTQDADTDRTAVSFRMVDPESRVRRASYAVGGAFKYFTMIENRAAYQAALDVFDAVDKPELTIAELWPSYQKNLRSAGEASKPKIPIPAFLKSLTRDHAAG